MTAIGFANKMFTLWDVTDHGTYGSLQTIKQTTKCVVPKGTIEKIIGKTLTWADDPYKLAE